MLVFNIKSWHFKIVKYVFGDSFFTERVTIDLDESQKQHKIIWRTKPRVVNFCPYARAVVMGIIFLPFACIRKKIPQKEPKPFDIKKSQRNIKLLRIGFAVLFGIWAAVHFINGDYPMAAFQAGVASFHLWSGYAFRWLSRYLEKKNRDKPVHTPTPRVQQNPSLIMAYLKSNHDKICPPVAFIDPNDTEVRR